MARYIDADELKESLEDFSKWCRDGRKQGVDFVLDCPLPNMPTADVAPRAEVAREIFEEITKMFFEKQRQYENSRQSGKARQMMVARCEVYKLQKKYTKAETDPPKGN